MRILIMGAGSMGSVIGGLLAEQGHEVVLLGRKPHMAAIRDKGLRITGIWDEHLVQNLTAVDTIEAVPSAAYDAVFITVKSYDTAEAVAAVAPFVGEKTLVCAYQNGLGNADHIAARFGWERTVGARAIFGAHVLEPGAAEVTVIAQPTALGAFRNTAPEGAIRKLVEALDTAGAPTIYSESIESLIWAKVAYNCALNPLSALLDVPYGRLAESASTKALMDGIIEELYAVGHAVAAPLAPADVAAYKTLFYEKLLPPTAAHYASMREDFQRGRRTEIDALNGAIIRLGAKQGLTCPINACLTRMVQGKENFMGVGV